MLYLTDNPATTASFLPRGAQWERLSAASLSDNDRNLWEVFGVGDELHVCEVPVPAAAAYPERRAVLIDHAVASQFDAAMTALGRGIALPDGLICIALEGAKHRGQRNRPWTALRGNLHLSAHYNVRANGPRVETALTTLPAVAAARAIRDVTHGRALPGIKWINDILLNGKKVSGVLTGTHVQGGDVECAVFGIGVNAGRAPPIEPTPFVPAAGSLERYGLSLSLVFEAVVGELDAGMDLLRTDGSARLLARYREMADFIGRSVCIWPEDCDDWRTATPLLQGQVRALHSDLSLDIDGHEEPVRKGRMAYL